MLVPVSYTHLDVYKRQSQGRDQGDLGIGKARRGDQYGEVAGTSYTSCSHRQQQRGGTDQRVDFDR